MTKLNILHAGIAAVAMLTAPAMAQKAIQEPGPMAQHYPNSDYLTGGWGVRASPGPGYYYRRYYGPIVRYYGPPVDYYGPAVGFYGPPVGYGAPAGYGPAVGYYDW
jgi:hypothetical protein